MNKYASIGFRVSAERKAEIEAAAEAAGISMSAWIKRALDEGLRGEQRRKDRAAKEEEERKKLTEVLAALDRDLLKMEGRDA